MSESTFITRHEFMQHVKNVQYIADAVRALMSNKKPSAWVTPSEAMDMIGCKQTKLKNLRREGKLHYKTSGSGRNIEYWRKGIEEYIEQNSTIMYLSKRASA